MQFALDVQIVFHNLRVHLALRLASIFNFHTTYSSDVSQGRRIDPGRILLLVYVTGVRVVLSSERHKCKDTVCFYLR